MYALPKTGAGALFLAVVALTVTGIGALLRWAGRR